MKFSNILKTAGKTPIVKLNRLFSDDYEVYMKIEKSNPGGSIKDRVAIKMIEDAENAGVIDCNTTIIEATSGNTGAGLSMVCAVKGYRIIIIMPESMSIERRKLMTAYGAELILTPASKGMKGAIEKANELNKAIKNSWIPSQFENNSNPEAHRNQTALEIIKDFPDGLDYLIAGVGSGGSITGNGEILKKEYPKIEIIAVEPELSPVLSGGKPGPHPIQGIGAGFVTKILNTGIYNKVTTVSKDDAFFFTAELAKKEGILAGISTGANLAAINKNLVNIEKGSRILTFCYDTGERYLSIDNLF